MAEADRNSTPEKSTTTEDMERCRDTTSSNTSWVWRSSSPLARSTT